MTTKQNILKAIRRQCVECMGGQVLEVAKCTAPKCSLFALRTGKDPSPCKIKVDVARARFSAKKSLVPIE